MHFKYQLLHVTEKNIHLHEQNRKEKRHIADSENLAKKKKEKKKQKVFFTIFKKVFRLLVSFELHA